TNELAYVLYSATTGGLEAVIVSDTDIRPGWSDAWSLSAVGTRLLARAESGVAALFGTGNEARSHLMMLPLIRDIRLVKVYSRDAEHRRAFCDEMQAHVRCELRPVERPEECLDAADIVLECTSTNVPVFDGRWLEPGQHVTTISGSNKELVLSGLIPTPRS